MRFCGSINDVVPVDGADDAPIAARRPSRFSLFKSRSSARLYDNAGNNARPSRDGLHSAPKPKQSDEASGGGAKPRKSHSAPSKGSGATVTEVVPPSAELVIEGVGGVTAEVADEYCADVLGPAVVKELRAPEWASRVRGVESLKSLLVQTAAAVRGSDAPSDGSGQQLLLFKATATVLARLLQDKVVPVYLPALELLAVAFSSPIVDPLPSSLAIEAVGHFGAQLVLRAGSSNVRAREESAAALLTLARCERVGAAVVCGHTLRPLTNAKSQAAATGRLDLIRSLLKEFGVGGPSSFELEAVLDFILPLCDAAHEKVREAATAALVEAHGAKPAATLLHIHKRRPSLAPLLTAKIAPPDGNGDGSGDGSARLPPAKMGGTGGRRLAPLAANGSTIGALPGNAGGRRLELPTARPALAALNKKGGASPPRTAAKQPSRDALREARALGVVEASAGSMDEVEEGLMSAILDASAAP